MKQFSKKVDLRNRKEEEKSISCKGGLNIWKKE